MCPHIVRLGAPKLTENAAELPLESEAKSAGRSRVSNGSKFAEGLDGRTKWGRRFKDLCEHYGDDLGGLEKLTASQLSLTKRAAALTVEIERHEAAFADKGVADPEALRQYQASINSLRRLLETLNLTGTAKAVARRSMPDIPAMSFGEGITLSAPGPNGEPRVLTPNEIEVARRLIFAINQSIEIGRPMHPELAAIAVGLGLASLPPGQTLPDIATDDTTTEDTTNAD
jgi:uncharacterized small protein (DUF1192 family)